PCNAAVAFDFKGGKG
ncbi:hypothetical protein MIMGU_mgv1a0259101mg, partial [Erythranthe guttata]